MKYLTLIIMLTSLGCNQAPKPTQKQAPSKAPHTAPKTIPQATAPKTLKKKTPKTVTPPKANQWPKALDMHPDDALAKYVKSLSPVITKHACAKHKRLVICQLTSNQNDIYTYAGIDVPVYKIGKTNKPQTIQHRQMKVPGLDKVQCGKKTFELEPVDTSSFPKDWIARITTTPTGLNWIGFTHKDITVEQLRKTSRITMKSGHSNIMTRVHVGEEKSPWIRTESIDDDHSIATLQQRAKKPIKFGKLGTLLVEKHKLRFKRDKTVELSAITGNDAFEYQQSYKANTPSTDQFKPCKVLK